MSLARRNGDVSFWYASTAIPPRRPPLPGDRQADVCIVGAGFTGLWTAYYLKRARPELEVVVLEREFAGFGASGRNGGWLSGRFAAPRGAMARPRARGGARPPARDAGHRGRGDRGLRAGGDRRRHRESGLVFVARGPAQSERLRATWPRTATGGSAGRSSTARRARGALRVAAASAGAWTPHCARVQPAKLVQGLAAAVGAAGRADLRGHDRARGGARRGAKRPRHRARRTCCAAWRASPRRCAGSGARSMPLNSRDHRHRAAAGAGLGGDRLGRARAARRQRPRLHLRAAHGRRAHRTRRPRGALPLRLADRPARPRRSRARSSSLWVSCTSCSPTCAGVPIAHAWCGVLGVPRDWCAAVRLDRATRPRHGRRLRGPRRGHREPGRAHAARPRARARRRELTRAAVGRAAARGAGSPSRCAGLDRAWCTGCTGRRIGARHAGCLRAAHSRMPPT